MTQFSKDSLKDPLARMVCTRTILPTGFPSRADTIEIDGEEFNARLSNEREGVRLEVSRYSAERELTLETFLVNSEGIIASEGVKRRWSGEPHMDMESFEQTGPYEDTKYSPAESRADIILEEWRGRGR